MRKGKNQVSRRVRRGKSEEMIGKRFSKLRYKALYVDLEYQEVSDIFKQAQKDFISSMFQFCSERKIQPPLENPDCSKGVEEVGDDSDIKDLYREIVMVTHPDKTANLSEEEIQSRSELYNEAAKGRREGDFWAVFKTALQLDIKIDDMSFEYLDRVEESVSELEGKICKIKTDLIYEWYYSNEDVKLDIFNKITANQEKYK